MNVNEEIKKEVGNYFFWRLAAALVAVLVLVILLMIRSCLPDNALNTAHTWSGEGSYEDELREHSAGAIVQVQTNIARGSGVLFDFTEDGYVCILTAGHVIGGSTGEIQITFGNGETMECTDSTVLDDTDLAYLYLPEGDLPRSVRKTSVLAAWDEESAAELVQGDLLYAAGYADEEELTLIAATTEDRWVYLEDFEQYMTLAQGEIQAGMSGGGLFDEQGRLVGILCGQSEDGELAAVPLQLILAFESFHTQEVDITVGMVDNRNDVNANHSQVEN